MGSLVVRSTVKKYILARLKARRPALGFTRVASEVYDNLDAELKVIIDRWIDSHPSVGKTFKP